MNKTINGLKKLISARRAHIVSSQPKAAFEKMPDLSIEKNIAVPPMPEIKVPVVEDVLAEVPAPAVAAEAPVEEAPTAEVAEVPVEEEATTEKPSRKSKKKKKS